MSEDGYTTPTAVTDAEATQLDTALNRYREVKSAQTVFEDMLKTLQSPFTIAPVRCDEERKSAASCLERAAALGFDGKHGNDRAMVTEALKCREPVTRLEKCTSDLELHALDMMRDSHRRMMEQQQRQAGGPSLPRDMQ
jgi:hypothetical protein